MCIILRKTFPTLRIFFKFISEFLFFRCPPPPLFDIPSVIHCTSDCYYELKALPFLAEADESWRSKRYPGKSCKDQRMGDPEVSRGEWKTHLRKPGVDMRGGSLCRPACFCLLSMGPWLTSIVLTVCPSLSLNTETHRFTFPFLLLWSGFPRAPASFVFGEAPSQCPPESTHTLRPPSPLPLCPLVLLSWCLWWWSNTRVVDCFPHF